MFLCGNSDSFSKRTTQSLKQTLTDQCLGFFFVQDGKKLSKPNPVAICSLASAIAAATKHHRKNQIATPIPNDQPRHCEHDQRALWQQEFTESRYGEELVRPGQPVGVSAVLEDVTADDGW